MTSQSGLPWGRARARLRLAYNYWVATTRSDGRPHSVPVWGVWLGEDFYFGTAPKTQKVRNLGHCSEIVVHLESGDDVVIIEGTATEVHDQKTLDRVDDAFADKYVSPGSGRPYRLSEDPTGPHVVYRVEPRVGYGWLEGAFSVTRARWTLGSHESG